MKSLDIDGGGLLLVWIMYSKNLTFRLSFTLISSAQIAWQHVEPDSPSPTFVRYLLQGVDSTRNYTPRA